MKIHFVDNWADAARACADIKTKAAVGLDMELIAGGKTTAVVQVAVSSMEVYVFDALVLGQPLFDACYLLPVLVDPRILKLCYDCRSDAEVLFNRHGVRAYGLYDMQMVFTSLFQSHTDPYLKGLRRAVQVMLSPHDARAFADAKSNMKRRFAAEASASLLVAAAATDEACVMSARPLTNETLLYCAEDAAMLMRMHSAWAGLVDTEEVVLGTLDRAARHIFRQNKHHHYQCDAAEAAVCCVSAAATPVLATTMMHLIDFPRLRVAPLSAGRADDDDDDMWPHSGCSAVASATAWGTGRLLLRTS